MNAKRLLALANFLDTVRPEKFDFQDIVDFSTWKGGQKLECGAAACALGYMPLVPEFKRLGLSYCWVDTEEKPTDNREDALGVDVIKKGVEYNDSFRLSFQTACIVLDIDRYESFYLFSPMHSGLGNKATPAQVAAHIRSFVERGGMP